MEAMGKGGQAYTMVCGNGCGSQEIMCRSHLCEPEAPQQRVQREVNPLPKIDETLAQITGAVGFGKSPSQSSRLLTTITTSSVGLSARWMMCWSLGKIRPNMTNDSQPYSSKSSLHAGVTLNPDKCEFGKTKLKFLGDLINESGIHGDPDKTSAIVEMRPPGNVSELRRFMGMVNQLGKFTPNLTELTQPLRELLTKKSTWLWGPSQNQAFLQVKAELVQATTLALYDVGAATKISADASPYGLGAVLLQEVNSSWKPVAYASRSVDKHERNYGISELETLGLVWAVRYFRPYLLGHPCVVYTDHTACLSILNTARLSGKLARWALTIQEMDITIRHKSGRKITNADALSRCP